MNNNLKAKGLVLRAGEKNLRDNVPIRFNDWAVLGGPKKDTADVTKTSLIKFSVLTHNHGVGGKATSRDCSVGTKSSLKLDRLEDNPKAVIEVWQSIFNELLPAMINVNPIMAVELTLTALLRKNPSRLSIKCLKTSSTISILKRNST